ncbi:ferrous iron transport protein B [Leptospira ryugenii]|uniref:Ferrous iron transport protein B n=2 Tax=Leptospira ryugenii TaxID=1917863 RepID=A0A2P2DZ89_9LEPT|nr:ferrous iron transport protein B [Leptospira ryugenii]
MNQNIYLVGNPNCGKTTLFNQLTGLNQKTGNFSGVTIDAKIGTFTWKDQVIQITDLPGTYGLGSLAEDKRLTFDLLSKRNPSDRVVFVLDALNLERSLVLLLQLMDMGIPVFVVLTMKDVLEKKKLHIDLEILKKELGLDFFLINAKSSDNTHELKEKLANPNFFQTNKRLWKWSQPEENFIEQIKTEIQFPKSASDFILLSSIKSLLGDPIFSGRNYENQFPEAVTKHIKQRLVEEKHKFSYQEEIIAKSILAKQIVSKVFGKSKNDISGLERKLDEYLLHPIFGFLFFFGIMAFLFQALFSWAEYPMNFLDSGISTLQTLLKENWGTGLFVSLLSDGILSGVGAVVVFVPQIALLFLFIGILEESGYLARASLLMDRLMGKFGLSGKSFIPLLSSAACAVPAIMGTRTIENKSERITTILISPLVMCSARYPVYILIVGTVFSSTKALGFFSLQGLVLFGMFLLGLLTSLSVGLIFKKTVFRHTSSYFALELPRYMVPSAKSLFHQVYQKVLAFLKSAGQIILYISVVLWYLSVFPVQRDKDTWIQSSIEDSYIGNMGKTIEPALSHLGFDWKIGISMITSFAAREVMVSTLAVLYGTENDEENISLKEKLKDEKRPNGSPVWTPLTGISLLLYFAFASQCMSTLAVVRKETGGFFWPSIQFLYMMTLALVSSFSIYQLGRLMGFS